MNQVRIAVDVASGDFGAPVLLRGVLDARRKCGSTFHAVLCGDQDILKKLLSDSGVDAASEGFTIEHCPQDVSPVGKPTTVWRRFPRSSVVRCVSLQKQGMVDASVSAGDTGVLMAAAVFTLGRARGVSRPALAAVVPTTVGRHTLLLDVGANIGCRPEHLTAFAALGRDYMKAVRGLKSPRVALLNVGAEKSKGTREITAVHAALAGRFEGFCGYIEGSRVLAGDADVVVCDGFAGNVMLKVCESFYALAEAVVGSSPELLATIRSKMAILDSQNYGAVPFLGINGVVLKAHGHSSARAVTSAIETTIEVVKRGAVSGVGTGSSEEREYRYA